MPACCTKSDADGGFSALCHVDGNGLGSGGGNGAGVSASYSTASATESFHFRKIGSFSSSLSYLSASRLAVFPMSLAISQSPWRAM
jgi:hypothetical protein